jgi:glyoxylase-like metal-dependent hydrolase (beta-lactamase superfamily II)
MNPIFSRRTALFGGALAFSAPFLNARGAIAQETGTPSVVLPTFYDRMVGDLRVTALLDGFFDLGRPLITNATAEQIDAGMTDAYLGVGDQIRLPISIHLIHGADGITMIDAGSGAAFGPTAGRVAAALGAMGIGADDVKRIVLTHMHPDHIGGLLSADGTAVFGSASLHVHETDLKFWTDEAIAASVPDDSKPFFALARGVAAAYGERLSPFAGSVDLGGGLSTVEAFGHTPGHSAVRVSSGTDQLLILGDAAAVAAVQFAHPDAGIAFDADGAQAAATRKAIFDMVSADRIAVAATHLPFPGVGHVEKTDGAYAWVPEHWQVM